MGAAYKFADFGSGYVEVWNEIPALHLVLYGSDFPVYQCVGAYWCRNHRSIACLAGRRSFDGDWYRSGL